MRFRMSLPGPFSVSTSGRRRRRGLSFRRSHARWTADAPRRERIRRNLSTRALAREYRRSGVLR